MKLDQLEQDSRIKRYVQLGSIIFAIAAVAAAAMVLTLLALSAREATADRYAAVGAVFAGAAFFLAIIAAVVALLAYAVSTGSPDLQLRIHFDFSRDNNPAFKAETLDYGRLAAVEFKQTIGRISLRNTSGYSANNPALIVRLQGMAFVPNSPPRDNWVKLDFVTTVGCIAIRWDGGPQYSIHGHSTRVLPSIEFTGLYHTAAPGGLGASRAGGGRSRGRLSLGAADDLFFGKAFGGAPGDVDAGRRVGAHPGDHDAPQGVAGLPVAAVVEPVPVHLP